MARPMSGRAGYVYLLSNPSMPGLVKIGRTVRDPSRRATELTSASGVPTPFRLEGYVRTDDAVRTEAEIHRRMGAERVNRRREFFRADPVAALEVARSVAAAERSRFSKGKAKARGASPWGLVMTVLYANAIFLLAGIDYRVAWQPMAANAALALLVPGRLWSAAGRLFGPNAFLTHLLAVVFLGSFFAITRGLGAHEIILGLGFAL